MQSRQEHWRERGRTMAQRCRSIPLVPAEAKAPASACRVRCTHESYCWVEPVSAEGSNLSSFRSCSTYILYPNLVNYYSDDGRLRFFIMEILRWFTVSSYALQSL